MSGEELAPTSAEAEAALTGAGGRFEVVTQDVAGRPMEVYAKRMPSLRSVAEVGLRRGDKDDYIVYGERSIGFGSFVQTANGIAHALRNRFDVAKGDRVAVLSQNNPEWCLTFWATVSQGAILVGLNGWWTTDEVVYGLQDSGASVLVADRKRFERIATSLHQAPELKHVFLIDCTPADVGLDNDPRVHAYGELVGDPTADFVDEEIAEDDPAVVFYTSGTTGRPKGATSTHRNMIATLQNLMYISAAGAITDPVSRSGEDEPPRRVSLFTSPLFHVSGCHSTLVVGLLAGIKLVMPEGRFTPELALSLIQEHQVSAWATVPTMVWRVCELPGRHQYDTSSVRSISFGGSPSADELQRMVLETFPNVSSTTNAYGLTETSSTATVISGRDAIERPASVGRPLPTVNVKIVGDADETLAPGETGEVCISGPILMAGYWNKPEATTAAIRDGWFHTGDVGHLDSDGYLYITDRQKDMIIRGGENIYCVEIEQRLVSHPQIADAAIVGVPHPELGEEVKAIVQLEAGAQLTEGEVRDWVAQGLAAYKVPAHVDLRHDKLPRNASGKLLKNVLRGEADVIFTETL